MSATALASATDVLLLDDDDILATALTLKDAQLLIVWPLGAAARVVKIGTGRVECDRRDSLRSEVTQSATSWTRTVGER